MHGSVGFELGARSAAWDFSEPTARMGAETTENAALFFAALHSPRKIAEPSGLVSAHFSLIPWGDCGFRDVTKKSQGVVRKS